MSEDVSGLLPRVLRWPVDPCWKIVSRYGERIHPVTQVRTFHSGIDIACPEGTAVMAPCPGLVNARWLDEKHGGGLSLRYKGRILWKDGQMHEFIFGFAHLLDFPEDVKLRPGRQRETGEVICFTGGRPGTPEAGRSTGPHLHMTVYVDGKRVDPLSLEDWDIRISGGDK